MGSFLPSLVPHMATEPSIQKNSSEVPIPLEKFNVISLRNDPNTWSFLSQLSMGSAWPFELLKLALFLCPDLPVTSAYTLLKLAGSLAQSLCTAHQTERLFLLSK
jgi:hypothetical protein